MARKIELTKRADEDLDEIYIYSLQEYGFVQARKFRQQIYEKMAMAAENPLIGLDCNDLGEGRRRILCLPYVIHYRQTINGILVLRILHGRMNPARHM